MIQDEKFDSYNNFERLKPQWRAKRTKNGKWIEGIPCVVYTDKVKRLPPSCNYMRTKTGTIYEIDHHTLTMFTGCYDKKDKPIYEGDIVIKENKYQRYVMYADRYGSFVTLKQGGTENYHADYLGKGEIRISNIEVVGNIYDNKTRSIFSKEVEE